MTHKLIEMRDSVRPPTGHLRTMLIDQTLRVIVYMDDGPNLILYSGADIMARILGGYSEYKIGAIYFEFKNLAAPGDPITEPTFDRTADVSYYNGLSGDTDFLRIPILVTPSISNSSDDYVGNQVTFFAVTSGVEGVNGLEFSESANSTVYGYGLVATPEPDVQTSDIVFARTYKTPLLKTNGHQIGAQWTIRFG